MELLRLAGVPGVGKSTTAWAVANRHAAEGIATAYIDIDQLGMCYPAPVDDPDRWVLKETALAAVVREFLRAGVERMVVSGVARPDRPPVLIPGVEVRSLWLRAAESTRRARLRGRGDSTDQLAASLSAGTLEESRIDTAWEQLATDELSEAETVAAVLARRAAASTLPSGGDVETSTYTGARMLWLTGPRLAGASRIGWEIVAEEWSHGRRTGFFDLAQLSLVWNVADAGVANLAAVIREFRCVGADQFVIVAPLEVDPSIVRAALPAADVTFVRLAADAASLEDRARARQRGEGPRLAGDDLLGASNATVARVLRTSVLQSSLPRREGELIVPIARRSPAEAAAAVRIAASW
ncbi:AAA family ATPase [Microbacterium sp. 1P06AB]|uniref:AAA family ATPase n=1 Tax=Microbacterium sp. 1P06AB TaxID=3132289 RepID=UPI0039A423F6